MMDRKGHEFDIINNNIYKPLQKTFQDACAELKKLGYGYVVPHKEIVAKGKSINQYFCLI